VAKNSDIPYEEFGLAVHHDKLGLFFIQTNMGLTEYKETLPENVLGSIRNGTATIVRVRITVEARKPYKPRGKSAIRRS
jgi:hypothetical protein